jgi:hypothetical protein
MHANDPLSRRCQWLDLEGSMVCMQSQPGVTATGLATLIVKCAQCKKRGTSERKGRNQMFEQAYPPNVAGAETRIGGPSIYDATNGWTIMVRAPLETSSSQSIDLRCARLSAHLSTSQDSWPRSTSQNLLRLSYFSRRRGFLKWRR